MMRLELPSHVVHVERLDGTRLAVAGVVHQYADRALGVLDRGHRRAHRLLVGHVDGERATASLRQVRDRLEFARSRVHPVAVRCHELGGGTADAGRASRDENGA
jgi:hypothetical protein